MDRNECKATGNRRLLQCDGLAAWQACGRVVTVEQADYFEFVVSFPSYRTSHENVPLTHLGSKGMYICVRYSRDSSGTLENQKIRRTSLSESCVQDRIWVTERENTIMFKDSFAFNTIDDALS